MRISQVKSLARVGSVENASSEAASRERYRRVTLGAIAGIIARGVSLVTVFISIPLVLAELGSEQFGIWATLASFTVLLTFADLGVANGLLNMLVRSDVESNELAATKHVTTALALLTAIAACFGLVFVSVASRVDWTAVYNTGASVSPEVAARATAVFAGCFIALIPLGCFQRVHLGYQEAFSSYIWGAVGSVIALAGVIGAAVADASLPWFVGATAGGPVIAALLNGVVLLGHSRPWLRPHPAHVSKESLRELASTGGAFFVIQSAAALAYHTGPIIVAQVKGASAVEDYAVPMRLFAFLPILLSIGLTAAWPALRSAVLQGDVGWARRALKRATWLGLLVLGPPTLGLVAFGDAALRLWTDDRIGASALVLLGFGAWALLSAVVWPLWTILAATNALTFQASVAVLMAIASIALGITLTYRLGVAGVVLGTALAQLVFFVLPSALYVPRLLRRLERAKAQ